MRFSLLHSPSRFLYSPVRLVCIQKEFPKEGGKVGGGCWRIMTCPPISFLYLFSMGNKFSFLSPQKPPQKEEEEKNEVLSKSVRGGQGIEHSQFS